MPSTKHNPRYAAFLMLIFMIMQSFNWLSIKYIYMLNPDITGIQVVLGRQFVASIATWIIANKDLKKHMYDSVPEG